MEEPLRKKRVLFIWFEIPGRPELLEPFVNLSHRFEFIHLQFNSKKERKAEVTPFEMIYWFDYATPYKLLKEIKPDVVFSEFPSDLKCIALKIAAGNLNIPYVGMTHGIYFEDSFNIKIENENSVVAVNSYSKYLKILRFYLSSIRAKNVKALPKIAGLLFYYMKDGYFEALKKVQFQLRWPDRYIVYQMRNSIEIMRDTHGFPANRLIPIGVPQFDSMFHYWNSYQAEQNETGNYFLLIDTAWIDKMGMPSSEIIYQTYLKLAEYCKTQNSKLVVKLHPHWYENKSLPQNENIVYLRTVPQKELSELIIKARGCFLYFSTLSIPVVPYKNCYFLYYKTPTGDVYYITSLGVAKSLNIEEIKTEEIEFFNGFDRSHIREYIVDYLFSIDGKATARLAKILGGNASEETELESEYAAVIINEVS
jgi:hypothetical protein